MLLQGLDECEANAIASALWQVPGTTFVSHVVHDDGIIFTVANTDMPVQDAVQNAVDQLLQQLHQLHCSFLLATNEIK